MFVEAIWQYVAFFLFCFVLAAVMYCGFVDLYVLFWSASHGAWAQHDKPGDVLWFCNCITGMFTCMFCSDLQPLVHELRITNQVMYVNPPVEDAQYQLLQELFAWEAIVTMLPRIQHSRYQVRLQIWQRHLDISSGPEPWSVLWKLKGLCFDPLVFRAVLCVYVFFAVFVCL